MWIITVYRDNGYSGENYKKEFEIENDAINYFSEEVMQEFNEEIENGLVNNQEIQNIISAGVYRYENEDYEVSLTLEEV